MGLFEPGQKLKAGAIEVLDRIGGGSLREVYRVACVRGGRREVMALKCFNPKLLVKLGAEAFQLIHRESAALSKVAHRGVITLHDTQLDAEVPFLIEEYLAHGNLSQMIAARRPQSTPAMPIFSPLEIARIGAQISSALVSLHQHELYHSDLRPQNLCIRHQEPLEIVIVDVDHLALLDSDILGSDERLSYLAYLPPERTGFLASAGDISGDLYSLGVTLYECATGAAPFLGQGSGDLINRLLFAVPRPLHEVFPGFPLALSDILAKLLRKEPAGRYHSAFGLNSDLGRCLETLQAGQELVPFALGTKDKLRELNYRIPMVGRQQEIATLTRLFDQTKAGDSALALIGAPSGTGKSRLALEVIQAAREEALVSSVKFSEYERNLPLSAITILLMDHARYLEGIAKVELDAWREKVKARLGSRLRLIAERFAFYAPLLGESKPEKNVDRDAAFQVFNQTISEFLSLLPARSECLLLLIDDLQWADWQSLQILSGLGRLIIARDAPRTMLMGTYRSDEVTSDHPLIAAFLSARSDFTLIELGALRRGDANTLVENLLDEAGEEVAKLEEVCFRFTGGNPFFIYEYLKSAIETGVFALAEDAGAWHFHAERIHRANLTNGVASLVAGRICGLSAVQQALLSIASVAGHAMRRAALWKLLPFLASMRQLPSKATSAKDMEQIIELAYQELLQKNILAPDSDRFAFFHDKVQEASYSLLTEVEKRALHHAYGVHCVEALCNSSEAKDDSALFEAAYHICQGRQVALPAQVRAFLMDAATAARRVFAYEKAKEYLKALIEAIAVTPDAAPGERFDALQAMADTLSISGAVAEAMAIYDQLLAEDCPPIKRARIYAKRVEFCLNLFDYKNARSAAEEALKVLGDRILTTEPISYLYIALVLPVLVIYSLYFRLFGRQTKEVVSDEESIRLLLLLKSEISQYFTQPIVAIANLIPLTFKLLEYKDNDFRATMICYWGVAISAFGVRGISNRFFSQAYEYFDKTANPVDKGFVLFVWGFTSDLPRGDLAGAQQKLEEAVSNLAPLGESFWRSISTLGLLLLDYYGCETGQAGIRAHEVFELWRKARYAATPLGCSLRHYLEDYNEEQARYLLEQVEAADLHIQSQGYDSIDSVFACVGIAEYLAYQGRYEAAERFAQRAFHISIKRAHRVTYALFPPIIYARILINRGKKLRAFGILLVAWLNQLLRVHVFRPHTCFETGRWLASVGLKGPARAFVQSGINSATRRQWWTPAAEGRLLLSQLLEGKDPELATAHLNLAREHFQLRHWKFHEALCDKELGRLRQARDERAKSGGAAAGALTHRGQGLRQQVEVQSLLSVLLKLSAINAKEPLFQAMLESLCHATGSELAVLYLEEDGHWQPRFAHNLVLEASESFRSKIDDGFVQTALQQRRVEPLIRLTRDENGSQRATTGSALMLPLMSEGIILGYCYLANTQLYNLFDRRSIDIAMPIATQGAIALRNIGLNLQLAVERDQIAELHRTLELRVIEQTRDIKSIMQHIKIGICTVSGDEITINKDYSQFLEQLLVEGNLRDKPLLPLLVKRSGLTSDEIDQARQALLSCLDGPDFAFDVNSHLLPRAIRSQDGEDAAHAYELDWSPICSDDSTVERVLVTISDVTEVRGLRAIAAKKDEELKLIGEILAMRESDWPRFVQASKKRLETSHELLSGLGTARDAVKVITQVFIHLHTLKGSARGFGLKRLSEVIHVSEQYFADALRRDDQPLDQATLLEKLAGIVEVLGEYVNVAKERLRRTSIEGALVSLPRAHLWELYTPLRTLAEDPGALSEAQRAALHTLQSELLLSLADLFTQLFKEAEPIAAELGKAIPEFELESPEIWVKDDVAELLRGSFVHLLRNSLDHGLYTSLERQDRGLPPRGVVCLSIKPHGDWLEFVLKDDGRGLNLKRLREIGIARGLVDSTQEPEPATLAALVFLPDLSTAERVTDLSGRGVGMTAVKDAIESLGGKIEVALTPTRQVPAGHAAFAFVIRLPIGCFEMDLSTAAPWSKACA